MFNIVEIVKNNFSVKWEVYSSNGELIEVLGNDPREEFDELGVEYFYSVKYV